MREKIEGIIFDWVGTLYQFDGKGLFTYSEMVLRELKPRCRMSLVSKTAFDNIENRNRQINIVRKYFKEVIVGVDKDRDKFLVCMRKMHTKPRNTLVVDDRVDGGIVIGNKLGCKTAWIQQGNYANITPLNETEEPTYKINSVEDLLTIL